MNFLVDESLSPRLCDFLSVCGDSAQHVRDSPGSGSPDTAVIEAALASQSVVVTADTDFGTLLSRSGRSHPSVILVRALLALPVDTQGALIARNLDQFRGALESGAVVVINQEGIRIRPLPIRRAGKT